MSVLPFSYVLLTITSAFARTAPQDKKIPLVDEVIELDAKNRAAKKEADDLRANKNKIAKQIGALMGQGKKEEAEELKKQVAEQCCPPV